MVKKPVLVLNPRQPTLVANRVLDNSFLEFSCILGSDDVHKDRCMRLVGDLSAKTRQYWCKVWGITVLMVQALYMQDPMHILLEGSAYWLNWLHLICIVLQCTSLYGSANLTQDCCFAANPCGGVSSRISELVSQGIFSSGNGLLHLPDQIVLYRPLRHHWCMHFETKNRFIKQRKW